MTMTKWTSTGKTMTILIKFKFRKMMKDDDKTGKTMIILIKFKFRKKIILIKFKFRKTMIILIKFNLSSLRKDLKRNLRNSQRHQLSVA